MKKYLFIIILIYTFSCKENDVVPQKEETHKITEQKTNSQEKVNDLAQKIGELYNPERMTIKGIRVEKNEDENYKITLTNSDLIDSDIKNVEKHAQKIAIDYYRYLKQNIEPLNLKMLIIKIEHRNTKIDSFSYSNENIIELIK
jgi:hypothetical protein